MRPSCPLAEHLGVYGAIVERGAPADVGQRRLPVVTESSINESPSRVSRGNGP